MVEIHRRVLKDLGLKTDVYEALPYEVVGGAWSGSFENAVGPDEYVTVLNHVVPAGVQLKLLFLRIWTQDSNGAIFSIVQTNPTAPGQTGAVEAYPPVGAVPEGVRDYPMLETAGAEVLHGNLEQPIHVLEGSIDFRIHGPITPSGARYGISWWGVQSVSERPE